MADIYNTEIARGNMFDTLLDAIEARYLDALQNPTFQMIINKNVEGRPLPPLLGKGKVFPIAYDFDNSLSGG